MIVYKSEVNTLQTKHPWKDLEREFINAGHQSRFSLKDISIKFNVPYQSVRRKAAIEKWHERRLYLWLKENATKYSKTSH